YTWLAEQPGKFAILELPFAPPGQMWENGSYVYWSTVPLHRVVDAHSGFAPPPPTPPAPNPPPLPPRPPPHRLPASHVRYVIIHHDLYKPWNRPLNFDLIRRTPWLADVQQFPDVDVLAVTPSERFLTRASLDR